VLKMISPGMEGMNRPWPKSVCMSVVSTTSGKASQNRTTFMVRMRFKGCSGLGRAS